MIYMVDDVHNISRLNVLDSLLVVLHIRAPRDLTIALHATLICGLNKIPYQTLEGSDIFISDPQKVVVQNTISDPPK